MKNIRTPTWPCLLTLWLTACYPEPGAPFEPLVAPDPPAAPDASVAPTSPGTPEGRRHAPPIAGGTLLATRDGRRVIASDVDRDLVWIATVQSVDLLREQPLQAVTLRAGDEPGRAVEDPSGLVHVALRSGGAVLTLDPRTATVVRRVPVCAAPRGIAWDADADLVHVACAGGDLVSLTRDGAVARRRFVAPDLRDVVAAGPWLFVTTFRKPAVYVVGADAVSGPVVTPTASLLGSGPAESSVAWRTVPHQGGLLMLSQAVATAPLGSLGAGFSTTYYGSVNSRTPAILPQVTSFQVQGVNSDAPPRVVAEGLESRSILSGGRGLSIDLAVNPDRTRYATVGSAGGDAVCTFVLGQTSPDCEALPLANDRAVAVVWVTDTRLAVQTSAQHLLLLDVRNPARSLVRTALGHPTVPALPRVAVDGRELFHRTTTSGFACASCHPEGGEDGRVWAFAVDGDRRTHDLRGGITRTAPFHWDGAFQSFATLTHTVFTERMGGPALVETQVSALAAWLDTVPPVPLDAPREPAAVARGRALFESPQTACTSCHAGSLLTDNRTHDVGTGGAFQVPSLVGVAQRAPYMHAGCATTLRETLAVGLCGGTRHGNAAGLSPPQLDDLLAYLATL